MTSSRLVRVATFGCFLGLTLVGGSLLTLGVSKFHSVIGVTSLPIGGVTPAKYSRTIPVGQRIIDKFLSPTSGCNAGIYSDETPPTFHVDNELKRHISVSPKTIPAKVGQQFELTYDASNLCQGQTIGNVHATPWNFNQDLKDVNTPVDGGWVEIGTVYWGDAGSVEGLTRSYGVLPHTYGSPGPRTILIQLSYSCIDYSAPKQDGCPGVFNRSVSVPVTVTP